MQPVPWQTAGHSILVAKVHVSSVPTFRVLANQTEVGPFPLFQIAAYNTPGPILLKLASALVVQLHFPCLAHVPTAKMATIFPSIGIGSQIVQPPSLGTECEFREYSIPTFLELRRRYGHVIPPGTAIPAWAYLTISDPSNPWNPVTARAVADSNAPESTAVPSSTSSPSSSSTIPVPPPTQSSSKSNTGAIVGGVVGGVLGLAILCLLGFFLYRYLKNKERRKVSTATPALFDPPSTQPSPAFMERKDQMSNYTASPGPPMSATHAPLKLYDPEDPTTFPDYQQPMPPMPQMSPSSGYTAPPASPPHIIL
ncbi:hypothetical protein NLI96_g1570 [Meripilus lineatus]|uniref:Uncharacterized protein n=1 Tax=Meripilus lineatus TaxID=2056292 RepID=A0AAD5V9U8_9APHY|nr:hypothetical protein NLI96_g1570 [Physisporinus lineatus]